MPGQAAGQAAGDSSAASPAERPNIVWITAEDMSPHFGAYGETAIETPNIDQLAEEGVLFENAFVTSPVCSPSRSALAAGMYQTTVGAHHHRSQGADGKRGGNSDYYESYEVPESIKLVPERFREAGYYTALGGFQGGEGQGELAKADYNFIWNPEVIYR